MILIKGLYSAGPDTYQTLLLAYTGKHTHYICAVYQMCALVRLTITFGGLDATARLVRLILRTTICCVPSRIAPNRMNQQGLVQVYVAGACCASSEEELGHSFQLF